ncbi:MAG: tRNA pseudouridine(38-40) synthase TruA [Bacteroidetes bacterium]|nr:tRNA pseudouridine(38-40) synthase TruA [Bacteroidota bacterium]MBU2585094.1 tRNA pseudouridine(38-40) synthase TruA [Bacteroidota bacterium]
MPRFKLYIEYEGTRYSGWQVQKNARTVHGELIGACKNIFKTDKFEVQGSGRTDAGVHALCQVAHLEVKTMLAPEIIRMKFNDELPADINILDVEKASPNFHARHDAVSRSYVYQISRRRTAFGKRYVWWIKDRLNFSQMEKASKLFLGMKNFQSFTEDDPEEKSTKVLIENIELKEEGDLILIRIVGSHFIWKLVRRVVGVLVEVGRGKMQISKIEEFIHTKSNEPAKFTAPPSGLFLEKVFYKNDLSARKLESTIRIYSFRNNL